MKLYQKVIFLGFFSINVFAQNVENLAKQKPFAISGSFDIRAIAYSADGIAARRSPFSYIISGSPTISIYGLSIPLSFTYSEQERSFRQPFNQFGLSPTYKWITLHAGYRNVSFSPYTLAGYTMLGAGVELTPNKWRIGFMYGRLNRATTIDTTTGATQPYSFSRNGYAAKLGYGDDNSFFQLSFLKAKDDETSLQVDNLPNSKVRPAENAVLGAETKLTFAKQFFIFADGGISIYTQDFLSKIELTPDPVFKTAFNSLGKVLKINGTTDYYTAYSGGFGYKSKAFSLKAQYKHIDPNFQSMGAYFFNSDVESFSLAPSFNALKGRLRFSGNIGLQHDNLRQQKQATTKRVIGSVNFGWDLSDKFGIDANYTNFSSNSEPTVSKVQEKYLLTNTTQNFSVNPRLILANAQNTHVILLSYNLSTLVDLNATSQTQNNINTNVILLNYNLTFNQSGLTIMAGLNNTTNTFALGTIKNFGATLGASKGFLKNQLQLSTANSFIISQLTQGKSNIINASLNVAYQPERHHRFSLRSNFISNSPNVDAIGQPKYSETVGEVGYTLSF